MARKPKVYKDDDWTDDYFTRHKTEYKRKPKVQNQRGYVFPIFVNDHDDDRLVEQGYAGYTG